jgi:transposase
MVCKEEREDDAVNTSYPFDRASKYTGMSHTSLVKYWDRLQASGRVNADMLSFKIKQHSVGALDKEDAVALRAECLRMREGGEVVELADLAAYLYDRRGKTVSKANLHRFLHKMGFAFGQKMKEEIRKDAVTLSGDVECSWTSW